jgi:hydroxymethylglutaryl-CoA synthase
VFEGEVQPSWREIASRWNLFERLEGRMAIYRETYEALHKGLAKESILTPNGEFALVEIGETGNEEGMRTYEWVSE